MDCAKFFHKKVQCRRCQNSCSALHINVCVGFTVLLHGQSDIPQVCVWSTKILRKQSDIPKVCAGSLQSSTIRVTYLWPGGVHWNHQTPEWHPSSLSGVHCNPQQQEWYPSSLCGDHWNPSRPEWHPSSVCWFTAILLWQSDILKVWVGSLQSSMARVTSLRLGGVHWNHPPPEWHTSSLSRVHWEQDQVAQQDSWPAVDGKDHLGKIKKLLN